MTLLLRPWLCSQHHGIVQPNLSHPLHRTRKTMWSKESHMVLPFLSAGPTLNDFLSPRSRPLVNSLISAFFNCSNAWSAKTFRASGGSWLGLICLAADFAFALGFTSAGLSDLSGVDLAFDLAPLTGTSLASSSSFASSPSFRFLVLAMDLAFAFASAFASFAASFANAAYPKDFKISNWIQRFWSDHHMCITHLLGSSCNVLPQGCLLLCKVTGL